MRDNTPIEWTDLTWSPTIGCDRLTEGCRDCYAIRTVHRMAHNPNPKVSNPSAGLTEWRNGRLDWTGKVNSLPDRLDLPLGLRRPRRIFVNSQSDLFHDDVTDEFVARVFAVMAAAHWHTFQILTKRHARMRALLNNPEFRRRVYDLACEYDQAGVFDPYRYCIPAMVPVHYSQPPEQRADDSDWWPLANVWMGVSTEDQATANLRIPALLETSAAIRFVSAEPLLGPVDLTALQRRPSQTARINALTGDVWSAPTGEIYATAPALVDWVIVGGESGPTARPMHPDWARSLRDQCAGLTAFLFKQWGEWAPAPWSVRVCDPAVGWQGTKAELAAAKRAAEARGATHLLQPSGHLYKPDHKTWSMERDPVGDYPGAIRRWGKKTAGRELDGRQWNEYPEVADQG